MSDNERTNFDRIAQFYDEDAADLFAESVITPTVDLLAEQAGSGRALELGIGTGRIALPLAERGVSVSGIDASESMVAVMRTKPGGGAEAIPVVIGDFATASVEGSFSLIYVVFNTFNNLRTQDKQVACFQNVAGHLESGARFVIEMFVPDLEGIGPGQNVKVLRADARGFGFSVYDLVRQRLTNIHFSIRKDGIQSFTAEGRYIWPAELDLMAQLAGLSLRERWAGWEREPFTDASRSHVSIYEKP